MRSAKRAARENRANLTRTELARKLEAAEKELAERRRIMAEEDAALSKLHDNEEEYRQLQPSVPLTGTIDHMYKFDGEKWWGGDSAEGIHLGINQEGERKAYLLGDVTGGRDLSAGRLEGLEKNHLRWGTIFAQRLFAGFISKFNNPSDREFIYSLLGGLNHNFAHHTPTEQNAAANAAVINSTKRTMRFVNAANPPIVIYNVTKGKFMRDHYFEGSGTYLGFHKIDTINPDKTVNYDAMRQFAAHYPMSEVKFDPNDRYEVFMMTDGLTEPFKKGDENKRLGGEQFHQVTEYDLGEREKPITSPVSQFEQIIHDHYQAVKRGEAEDSHGALAKKVYSSYGRDFVANEREHRLQMVSVLPLKEYEKLLPPKTLIQRLSERFKYLKGRRRSDVFSFI